MIREEGFLQTKKYRLAILENCKKRFFGMKDKSVYLLVDILLSGNSGTAWLHVISRSVISDQFKRVLKKIPCLYTTFFLSVAKFMKKK